MLRPGDRVMVPFNIFCGHFGAQPGDIVEGDVVVAFGAGPVGLFAATSAWLMGAGRPRAPAGAGGSPVAGIAGAARSRVRSPAVGQDARTSAAASPREATSSLPRMLATWNFTVFSLMFSRSAI